MTTNPLNPFAQLLLRTLDQAYRDLHGAVKMRQLVARLNQPRRTIQYYLARLEAAGQVRRKGKKGGWLPARSMSEAIA